MTFNLDQFGNGPDDNQYPVEVSILKIPTFADAMRRFDAGEATPLDEFIYDNEPADPMDARDFREGLQDVIDFVLSHKGSDE